MECNKITFSQDPSYIQKMSTWERNDLLKDVVEQGLASPSKDEQKIAKTVLQILGSYGDLRAILFLSLQDRAKMDYPPCKFFFDAHYLSLKKGANNIDLENEEWSSYSKFLTNYLNFKGTSVNSPASFEEWKTLAKRYHKKNRLNPYFLEKIGIIFYDFAIQKQGKEREKELKEVQHFLQKSLNFGNLRVIELLYKIEKELLTEIDLEVRYLATAKTIAQRIPNPFSEVSKMYCKKKNIPLASTWIKIGCQVGEFKSQDRFIRSGLDQPEIGFDKTYSFLTAASNQGDEEASLELFCELKNKLDQSGIEETERAIYQKHFNYLLEKLKDSVSLKPLEIISNYYIEKKEYKNWFVCLNKSIELGAKKIPQRALLGFQGIHTQMDLQKAIDELQNCEWATQDSEQKSFLNRALSLTLICCFLIYFRQNPEQTKNLCEHPAFNKLIREKNLFLQQTYLLKLEIEPLIEKIFTFAIQEQNKNLILTNLSYLLELEEQDQIKSLVKLSEISENVFLDGEVKDSFIFVKAILLARHGKDSNTKEQVLELYSRINDIARFDPYDIASLFFEQDNEKYVELLNKSASTGNPHAFYDLGFYFAKKGQHHEAEPFFIKACDQGIHNAWRSLLLLYSFQKRDKEIRDALEKALSYHLWEAYYLLSFYANDPEEQEQCFSLAIETCPLNSEILIEEFQKFRSTVKHKKLSNTEGKKETNTEEEKSLSKLEKKAKKILEGKKEISKAKIDSLLKTLQHGHGEKEEGSGSRFRLQHLNQTLHMHSPHGKGSKKNFAQGRIKELKKFFLSETEES